MSIEGILANIGVMDILNKLVPVIAQEINLAWGVKDELKKLQDTLQMILAVIADAETRQVTEKAVGLWLRRLKDVAYDADDVMVEFSYETMRRSARGSDFKYKAREFISSANLLAFRFKMAGKIKHINQRLDAVTKDMSKFQLQITPSSNTSFSHGGSQLQTESSVDESNITGREDDKKRIIDMLTLPSTTSSDSNNEMVSVISIVGMGGLGKTTLAQLVYKDTLVKEQFKLRMWVHVSDYFDVEKLLTKIMESSTQNKFDTLSNFDVLASKVRQQLNRKKYLLVLDDLWNESDEQWERLCSPLLVGAQGSKILITTRKIQVANVVKRHIPPYVLKKLPDDECWSIIKKKAFSPGGALQTAKMTSIGLEIAKKCCGLPLAAKFLGSLMNTRNTEVDWLSIQENDIFNTPESQNRVMSTLKLSYDNLSSNLKQCFSYCSIFPKGCEVDRLAMVQMWMAEGFLDTCKVGNGRSIEDIGDEYFGSLVWSSFFEAGRESRLGEIMAFKMHDIVHDFARAVVGDNELVSLKVSEFKNTSGIRRLQLILDADLSSTFLKNLGNAEKLRTLYVPEGSNLDPVIFLRNQHLRILHVGHSPNPTYPKLSALSFKPRHLRYLHLSCLDFSTQVVDDSSSITKLYNLETLVLACMRGSIENLLINIHSLKKLRHLDISGTEIDELPDSVTSLCNLQTLDLSHCKLKSLPESATGLRNLRFLDISSNLIQQLPGFIINLGNLQTLDVKFCRNLKSLPECVKGLQKLQIFDFDFCGLLEKLPEDFGALTQLRCLSLFGTGIKVLPESCASLINLESVNLSDCDLPKQVNSWTKVRKFDYRSEEEVTPVGIGKLVWLEKLKYWVREKLISGTNGIDELGNLNTLEKLDIINLQNVKDPIDAKRANLMGKQNLRELRLCWDETKESSDMVWDRKSCSFQVFEALQPHAGLSKLEIVNFMGCNLPTWMCGLPTTALGKLSHLTVLRLTGLMSLKSLDIGGLPSITELYLSSLFSLQGLTCSCPSPSLQHLSIYCCTNLKEIPSFPCLDSLSLKDIDHQLVNSVGRTQTSLTRLDIENIKELIYFPTSIFLSNCHLQILTFVNCSKCQGFGVIDVQENENVFTQFSPETHGGFLQGLVLADCPVLKFIPDLRGWTSLRNLFIQNCPGLKESFTYDLEKSLSFLKHLHIELIDETTKIYIHSDYGVISPLPSTG